MAAGPSRGKAASGGLSWRAQLAVAVGLFAGAGAGFYYFGLPHAHGPQMHDAELSAQAKRPQTGFKLTDAQWATITAEPVERRPFQSEHVTEGKIAVDEDRSTPIFSPYAGRVTKLFAKPGDAVVRGQPLFVVEATDMVQAQNDFIAAITALNKAKSHLNLAQIVERRQRLLYEGKAIALKDWQQAQAELTNSQNDLRTAEVALEAARNRLRIIGKTDEEITAFQQRGAINAETVIAAPIGGTIVQRKVGPGQYVTSGASDPVFVIGDLSTVWVIAYVRETEAPKVRLGQVLKFTVLAYPNKIYEAKITYLAAALDPATRRLLVRTTVDNRDGELKPEMFANVSIFTDDGNVGVAVPRSAIIYEGETARVWVARDDQSIELRRIKPGLVNGNMVQALEGLEPGEKVITKGSLFIDRLAVGS